MSFQSFPINKPFLLTFNEATFLATIDGNRCKTVRELFNEMAFSLRFPTYFGHNFDGLADCLMDLDWLGVDTVYLQITHAALICSEDENENMRPVFDSVLKDVIQNFKSHPIHFCLIAETSFLHLLIP